MGRGDLIEKRRRLMGDWGVVSRDGGDDDGQGAGDEGESGLIEVGSAWSGSASVGAATERSTSSNHRCSKITTLRHKITTKPLLHRPDCRNTYQP